MTPTAQPATSPQPTLSAETLSGLHKVPILSSLDDAGLRCLAGAVERRLEPGELLLAQGDAPRKFYILLSGSLRVSQVSPEGHEQTVHVMEEGIAFGEITLLANMASSVNMRAMSACMLVELSEEIFWSLITSCPQVRQAILSNLAMRLAKMQSVSFQQEKMATLGTMAAGLMHELNNPGAAALRAASQLRENLMRLHELAARFTRIELTPPQKECILDLQQYALHTQPKVTLSSLEQADAEEALSEWMERAHIDDAWKLAPTLVSIGIDAQTLECARSSFDGQIFSDALNWLEALVSSQQLVSTIEESISRVTELVQAVKSYAYEGRGQKQAIDVNHSIHATLVILAHKLREKQIGLEKSFGANLPPLAANCQNLNQVWTNLLDNAIDAVGPGGRIKLKTWAEDVADAEPARTDICILVEDNGAGIPTECQAHIFDPFFTTKPAGIGTGLGLGIVFRIVEQCGGSIRFTSIPGSTEFLVRLPAQK